MTKATPGAAVALRVRWGAIATVHVIKAFCTSLQCVLCCAAGYTAEVAELQGLLSSVEPCERLMCEDVLLYLAITFVASHKHMSLLRVIPCDRLHTTHSEEVFAVAPMWLLTTVVLFRIEPA